MFGSSTCQTSHLCQYLINTSTYIWCHHVIVLSVDTCHLMYPMMGIQICAVTFSSCFKPDFISYCTERMQSRIPFSVIWFTIFFISQNVLSQLSLIIRNTMCLVLVNCVTERWKMVIWSFSCRFMQLLVEYLNTVIEYCSHWRLSS